LVATSNIVLSDYIFIKGGAPNANCSALADNNLAFSNLEIFSKKNTLRKKTAMYSKKLVNAKVKKAIRKA